MIIFNIPMGATPLDPDEIDGLIPKHIRTQRELNAWEEQNIIEAQSWQFDPNKILTVNFVRDLHKHMFNMTWKWAGEFRRSQKNIGTISWHMVSENIKRLCDNTAYQLNNKEHTNLYKDEIIIRFHHKLTWIHPFPNGNGRHARLMADILIMHLGLPRFSWGMNQKFSSEEKNLYIQTPIRKQYIEALQRADNGDYSALLTFARS